MARTCSTVRDTELTSDVRRILILVFVSLTGALVMDVTYGIKILPENDPYIKTAEEAMSRLSEAVIPGSFLVDFLPMRTLVLILVTQQ